MSESTWRVFAHEVGHNFGCHHDRDNGHNSHYEYGYGDYYLGDDGHALADTLENLHELHSRDTLARWQAWAREGQLPLLFEELMRLHYDPSYARSQAAHLFHWDTRRAVHTADLSEAGIAALARQVLALPAV